MRNIQRRRAFTAFVCLGVCALAYAYANAPIEAQAQSSAHTAVTMQRAGEFRGDVRRLPVGLPGQREGHPDRDEPSLSRGSNFNDPVAQSTGPSLPAPSPGTGGGAGSFAGLDFANWGDGW